MQNTAVRSSCHAEEKPVDTIPPSREYGALRAEDLSQKTVLAEMERWKLTHHSAGYEPAGSMARYTHERWSVTFYDSRSNETHGRSFRTPFEAQQHFDAMVTRARQMQRDDPQATY